MADDLLRVIKLRIIEWQVDAETEKRNDESILANVDSMLQLNDFPDDERELVVDWIKGIIETRFSARMQTKIMMGDCLQRSETIRELRSNQ